MEKEKGRMEGWLYLIRSNRFGLQYSRKRYFVLQGDTLNCYKFIPATNREEPIKSALIDSCIRATDNGRESIHKNVFFIFTLYNTTNPSDHLKLGARSSEEAAKWIKSLMEAALKECSIRGEKIISCSKSRLTAPRRARTYSLDWTVSRAARLDVMASDVLAPSSWAIFGCQNGLRLFKENKDGESYGKGWEGQPAVMAVGVVDAPSEAIFRTLMSLGQSRSEWDFCFSHGNVIEHLDGHTDIIHKKLRGDWLPWGMKRRDLLLQRYWRREDDGTYVILYHSVFHPKCQPERGYVRACLKSGGYVISPANQGKQSVVKHMLSIDWRFWKSYVLTSSDRYISIRMLGRVAALRELFRTRLGNQPSSDFSSGEITKEIGLPLSEMEHIKVEVQLTNEDKKSEDSTERSRKSYSVTSTTGGSIHQLNDAADEFFDVPDDTECEYHEALWPPDSKMNTQEQLQPKLSPATVFIKKLHDRAVQRKVVDFPEATPLDASTCSYGTSLPKDSICTMNCSWANSDPSSYLIRGETYLRDSQKIKANGTLMQFIGADWLKSDKREDDLAGRPGSIVQKCVALGGKEFFFIVNLQIPGLTRYNLGFYFMMENPLESVPLLANFVKGDNKYRNSRFKLIPYISKGSWIVKQSVGRKACLVGQALELNYIEGKNYFEIDIDVGSSTVAKGVTSLILSYLNNLVIELAFLIQSNTQEELPERLLGTCRINNLDSSKAVPVSPSL